jgi:hypothetical protein
MERTTGVGLEGAFGSYRLGAVSFLQPANSAIKSKKSFFIFYH